MEGIRQYLLSIVAAALISTLAISLIGKKGLYSAIVKLLAGLYLSITVISPWTKLQFADLSAYLNGLELDATDVIAEGEYMASEAVSSIIIKHVEAYILDKASALDLQIEVEITLTDADPPSIHTVIIKGSASPYAKQQLQQIIAEDIGVPKENQSWI